MKTRRQYIQQGRARNNHGQFIGLKARFMVLGIGMAVASLGAVLMASNQPNQPLIEPLVSYAEGTPVPTPVIKHSVQFSYDDIVDYIWYRESGRGKYNPPYSLASNCYAKGEFNEWGFGGMQNPKCFKTLKEGKDTVYAWISRYMKQYNGDVVKTLCMYNVGLADNCEYGTTFLAEHTYEK